ncbi:MAG TPA: hypothetical protein VJL89_02760 [Thermodesulfovibrionia bacterium]|nr:hypothetical protein [Thermodesulfovibrionia bacterium]
MKPVIYTFGYDGWGPHAKLMKKVCIEHNRKLKNKGLRWIDIRFNRKVRAEGFREGNVEAVFTKEHYRWIQELGNKAIVTNQPYIELADTKTGYRKLLMEIKEAEKSNMDLILFCHCPDYNYCHRKTVFDEAPKELKTLFCDLDYPEWPPFIIDKIDLTHYKTEFKLTSNGYLYLPHSIEIKGVSSPFVISQETEIVFYNKHGNKQSLTVERVTPSADEKIAKIKGYVE